MSERRTEKRFDVCLDVIWDGTTGKYEARITDLSEGGCYIDAMCTAHQGQSVNLRIQMPNEEWLELTGEVAHHFGPVGFGVQFSGLRPEQLQKLRGLIKHIRESSGEFQPRV